MEVLLGRVVVGGRGGEGAELGRGKITLAKYLSMSVTVTPDTQDCSVIECLPKN